MPVDGAPRIAGLQEYLRDKRIAVLALKEKVEAGERTSRRLRVETTAEGRSGVRRIRVDGHQIIMDSPAELAGNDLGPSSQGLLLGVLSSCITHITLIQASLLEVPLDGVKTEVTATQDPRAGTAGFEDVPIYPHDIEYTIRVDSSASDEVLGNLHAEVEKNCPIYNFLSRAHDIRGTLINIRNEQ